MTAYIGPNAYHRTPNGEWFFFNGRGEVVVLDVNDPIDAVTIATLDRNNGTNR